MATTNSQEWEQGTGKVSRKQNKGVEQQEENKALAGAVVSGNEGSQPGDLSGLALSLPFSLQFLSGLLLPPAWPRLCPA